MALIAAGRVFVSIELQDSTRRYRLEIYLQPVPFYSNSIIVLNDLYTAVVTVAILGTPCYTGNSLKKFSKNI